MRLNRQQRIQARRIARACWVRSNGDIQQAELLLKSMPEMQAIDPALILLIVRIALELFAYWRQHHISEPQSVATADEPGGDDDEE